MSLSEGAGGARKLGSAARRRNIGAVGSSLKASARRVFRSFWIFDRRDHGGLLQITGQPCKAVQYAIGNPLTATRMTKHQLAASLYAPLRVVLYETEAGHAVFEYDRPSSLLGQFGDERVTAVARELDASLERKLVKAAS